VIGVTSTAEKALLARKHGAAHTIIGHENLSAEIKRITGGEMVPVVYDSIGRVTFNASLDCLAPLGLMVSFGNSSGPVPPVELSLLSAKGSLFLTRPSLATYTAKPEIRTQMAADLFTAIQDGVLTPHINQTFRLEQAADAHLALEARQTTGQTVLIP
jgi:NADPH2:quinone reductase